MLVLSIKTAVMCMFISWIILKKIVKHKILHVVIVWEFITYEESLALVNVCKYIYIYTSVFEYCSLIDSSFLYYSNMYEWRKYIWAIPANYKHAYRDFHWLLLIVLDDVLNCKYLIMEKECEYDPVLQNSINLSNCLTKCTILKKERDK